VESPEKYVQIMKTATEANKLVVVDFFANWCAPCKVIAPIFANYSEEYPNTTFVRVNVDELEDIAQEAEISAMPTFQFFLGGEKVDQVEGADKKKLKDLLEKYSKV